MISAWVFEYPSKFYAFCESFAISLDKSACQNIICLMTIGMIGLIRFLLFYLQGLHFHIWKRNCWSGIRLIFYLPKEDSLVTMPVLYLTLLTLQVVTQVKAAHGYQPERYRVFIYGSPDHKRVRPLGIYDPLSIINSLIDTLQQLWHKRYYIRFLSFDRFAFRGLCGRLSGRRRKTGQDELLGAVIGLFIRYRSRWTLRLQPTCGGYCQDAGDVRTVVNRQMSDGYCSDTTCCPYSQRDLS